MLGTHEVGGLDEHLLVPLGRAAGAATEHERGRRDEEDDEGRHPAHGGDHRRRHYRPLCATGYRDTGGTRSGTRTKMSFSRDLAIVGGTGLYNDARGTLTIIRTTHSPRPIRELLYFRLAG